MSLWPVLLFLVTVGMLLLPLLPALIELAYPTDVAPLRVVQAYDNNPMHFAQGFTSYISNHFGKNFGELHKHDTRAGAFADGTNYEIVGEDGKIAPMQEGGNKVILSPYALRLPEGGAFDSEVYSETTLASGSHCSLRAAYSEGGMELGPHTTLLRWAHSNGDMHVGANSTLYGRATSMADIFLAAGCNFERLHARKIITGEALEITHPTVERTLMEQLKGVKMQAERRSLLEGDLDFPAYHTFDGDIVAGSTAMIGDYAHIKGSVKSNALNDLRHYLHTTGVMAGELKNAARCELGHYVRIDGSVVSTHDLIIGPHCRISGPVIAENLLVIRTGAVIGTPEYPCTVSAQQILIETGCVIYGTLWAGKLGTVMQAQEVGV